MSINDVESEDPWLKVYFVNNFPESDVWYRLASQAVWLRPRSTYFASPPTYGADMFIYFIFIMFISSYSKLNLYIANKHPKLNIEMNKITMPSS